MKEHFQQQIETPLMQGAPLIYLFTLDDGTLSFRDTTADKLEEDLAGLEFVKMGIDGQTPVFKKSA